MNLITILLIYLPMAYLLFRCVNPAGPGLLRLFRISRDLKEAAAILRDKDYGNALEHRIRNGGIGVPEELFATEVLIGQMQQYCDRIHSMQLNPNDKCQTNIDEYFSFEFLEQQGKTDLCEHTANGMTALGLLGTFIGLTGGLRTFGEENSAEILAGISGLLDGMNTAFITSIFGIALSLVLGYVLRIIISEAEKHLSQFLTNFHNNVMRNQAETAFNELIKHIVSVESGLSASNEIQVNALDRVVTAFITKLNDDLGLQVDILRAAVQDMTAEHNAHNTAVQKLTRQMNDLGVQLNQVSSSFLPVVTQTNTLADQLNSANRAMQEGLDHIHTMVNDDETVLSRHKEVADELLRTTQALEQAAASIQNQAAAAVKYADSVTLHCETLAQDNLKALSKCLADFALAAETVNHGIQLHGMRSIDTLQQHTQEVLHQLPPSGISSGQVNALLAQNEIIIQNQQKLLQLMERNTQKKRARLNWRGRK